MRVWVNNAGVLALGPAWTHPDAEIERCVETNVLGTMHGSRAAVEVMRDQPAGGSILNIASFAAFGAVPGLAVYAGSKHAVLGFTTSLNADLRNADSRIRATVACLDGTDTPMVRRHAGAGVLWHRGRLLDPDEVARRLVNALSSRRQVVCVPAARGVRGTTAGSRTCAFAAAHQRCRAAPPRLTRRSVARPKRGLLTLAPPGDALQE